jgi:hypothetical protein
MNTAETKTVNGQWKWQDSINSHIFLTNDGKRYCASHKRTDFSVTSILVRPPRDNGTIQGRIEFIFDGAEVEQEIEQQRKQ